MASLPPEFSLVPLRGHHLKLFADYLIFADPALLDVCFNFEYFFRRHVKPVVVVLNLSRS